MSSNWYFDKYYQYKDLEFKLTSLKIYEIYFQNNLIGTLLLNKAKNISTVSYKKKYKTNMMLILNIIINLEMIFIFLIKFIMNLKILIVLI